MSRLIRPRQRTRVAYADAGPFATILFHDKALGRVLDQSLVLGNREFTVSLLVEATDLTFKTVQSCLEHLQKIGWVSPTRRLGNAQVYKFNLENHLSKLVGWALEFQQAKNNQEILVTA